MGESFVSAGRRCPSRPDGGMTLRQTWASSKHDVLPRHIPLKKHLTFTAALLVHHRLLRWPTIKPTLDRRLVFTEKGISHIIYCKLTISTLGFSKAKKPKLSSWNLFILGRRCDVVHAVCLESAMRLSQHTHQPDQANAGLMLGWRHRG